MKPPEYQRDLSLQSPILLDLSHKQVKVDKMLAILKAGELITETPKELAVDVGCSRGFFTSALSPYFRHVIGVDIDTHAVEIAKKESQDTNLHYVLGDSLRLPLEDKSVDLIICNHVYEHVPSAERLFSEIGRVLKDTGACYLGAASRLTIVEPHYHLLFLSWLPKWLAHRYMRLMGKGAYYYENLRTFWGVRRLINQFVVSDYTLQVISDPDRFKARDLFPKGGVAEKIPLFIWKSFYWFLPTYIFILRKRNS